jgi:hypothetical protein
MSKIRFVGLDVHADTIAVAVAEMGGEGASAVAKNAAAARDVMPCRRRVMLSAPGKL